MGGGLARPDGLPRARGRVGPQAVAPGAISLRRPPSDPPARHLSCCWGALTLRRHRWGRPPGNPGTPGDTEDTFGAAAVPPPAPSLRRRLSSGSQGPPVPPAPSQPGLRWVNGACAQLSGCSRPARLFPAVWPRPCPGGTFCRVRGTGVVPWSPPVTLPGLWKEQSWAWAQACRASLEGSWSSLHSGLCPAGPPNPLVQAPTRRRLLPSGSVGGLGSRAGRDRPSPRLKILPTFVQKRSCPFTQNVQAAAEAPVRGGGRAREPRVTAWTFPERRGPRNGRGRRVSVWAPVPVPSGPRVSPGRGHQAPEPEAGPAANPRREFTAHASVNK